MVTDEMLAALLGPPPWRVKITIDNAEGEPVFIADTAELVSADDTVRIEFSLRDVILAGT